MVELPRPGRFNARRDALETQHGTLETRRRHAAMGKACASASVGLGEARKDRLEHTWTLLHARVRPECAFLRLHDDLILSYGYDVDSLLSWPTRAIK